MKNHKEEIIRILNSRGHVAYEEKEIVWALIKGVKTEWNWKKGDNAILIGFLNNHRDIEKLCGIIPPGFTQYSTKNAREGTNVIKINQYNPTPANFEDVVKLMENPSFEISKPAKPRPKKGTKKHYSEGGSDSPPPSPAKNEVKSKKTKPKCYTLDQDDIDILNSQCGTGDFPNADVLFFGNEEGFGGKDVHYVISERKKHFQNDNLPIDGHNKMNGHYYLDNTGDPYPMRSQFLKYCSRLMLKLSNPEGSWCAPMSNPGPEAARIRKYQKEELYREKTPLKSALFELRPLPREKEGTWPYCIPGSIDRGQYRTAFSCNWNGHLDSYHTNLRKKRITILKNILSYSKAKTIIGVGAKDFKRCFFENMYQGIEFEEINLATISIYCAELEVNEKIVRVYLCPFFGQGREGFLGLDDLCTLGNLISGNGI